MNFCIKMVGGMIPGKLATDMLYVLVNNTCSCDISGCSCIFTLLWLGKQYFDASIMFSDGTMH